MAVSRAATDVACFSGQQAFNIVVVRNEAKPVPLEVVTYPTPVSPA